MIFLGFTPTDFFTAAVVVALNIVCGFVIGVAGVKLLLRPTKQERMKRKRDELNRAKRKRKNA